MRRALITHKPATLMILGTSDGMLSRICENLWLNPPSMLIRIEDVSTEEEMRQAREVRLSQGKHAIPVPSVEIKHEFSGTFADRFSRLRRKRDRGQAAHDAERTVVRPTFFPVIIRCQTSDAHDDREKIIKRFPGPALN